RAAMETFSFNAGEQAYSTYGGLLNFMDPQMAGVAAGSYGAMLSPAISAGMMGNALFKDNPIASPMMFGVTALAGLAAQAYSTASDPVANSNQLYLANKNGPQSQVLSVLSNPGGAIGNAVKQVFDR